MAPEHPSALPAQPVPRRKSGRAPITAIETRYVLIPLFCASTGYTDKAVRRKIQSGVWLQGQLWRKAPDGRILIDMEGYIKWVEHQISPESKSVADPSA